MCQGSGFHEVDWNHAAQDWLQKPALFIYIQ
jgi:hypothetical protein